MSISAGSDASKDGLATGTQDDERVICSAVVAGIDVDPIE
jgi:hypothetical protein